MNTAATRMPFKSVSSTAKAALIDFINIEESERAPEVVLALNQPARKRESRANYCVSRIHDSFSSVQQSEAEKHASYRCR
jgi:hypothetical protein